MEDAEIELWGWTNYFTTLATFLLGLNRNKGIANLRYSEHALERLEISLSSVHSLIDHFDNAIDNNQLAGEELQCIMQYKTDLQQLVSYLQQVSSEWQGYADTFYSGQRNSGAYRVSIVPSASPGRPKFQITREQIEYLRSLSFPWCEIASILGISRMTLYQHRRSFGLVDEPRQTLSDDQLTLTVSQLREQLPVIGETIAIGRLRSLGFHITRERVRQSLRSTDPINTTLRWRANLSQRRPYSVPGPNSLWHIGIQIFM